jgi:hypothetical protein
MTENRHQAIDAEAQRRVLAALSSVRPGERPAVLRALINEARQALRRETVPAPMRQTS